MAYVNEPERRGVRWTTAVLVALLHLLLALGLIRAFAPGIARQTVAAAMATISLPQIRPGPPPKPHSPSPAHAAAPGRAAKAAVAIPRAAPTAPIVLAALAAPPVAATGTAPSAGAAAAGNGSGAGGTGSGGGVGDGRGDGQGRATEPVKIAGGIDLARDYPAAGRALRRGDFVIIEITVSPQGSPIDCKVLRPSRDAEAGPITCNLALARFRFRAALDGARRPIEGVYGWKQRWFAP